MAKRSLSETQDRILTGFSHDGRSTTNNSAVAKAIELGAQNANRFKQPEAPEFSCANPEWFKSSLKK